MPEYLKKAARTSTDDAGDVRDIVQKILDEIEAGGDDAARKYAAQFDKYDGNIVLTRDEIDAGRQRLQGVLEGAEWTTLTDWEPDGIPADGVAFLPPGGL